MYLFIYVGIIILGLLGIEIIIIKNDRKRLNRESVAFLSDYEKLIDTDYIEQGNIDKFKETHKNDYKHMVKYKSDAMFKKELALKVKDCISKYNDLDKYALDNNNKYYEKEKEKYKDLFSINGLKFDDDQINAIVSKEKNVLVAAGAGSGKTLTIIGKIIYLVKAKKIKTDDILVIPFNRKIATEMTDKISKLLKVELKAKTFEKLGLDILKENYKVADAKILSKTIDNYFMNDIKDEDIETLIKYFAYDLNIPSEMRSFDNIYEYPKYRDYETLKSKFEKSIIDNVDDKRKLKQELVHSYYEEQIANFLFLNGINYEYKSTYKNDETYKPDFYLTDYNIYIEHFDLDKKGKVLSTDKEISKNYMDNVIKIRNIHKINNTDLIEVYPYYFNDNTFINDLMSPLVSKGVKFNLVDYKIIYNDIFRKMNDKYFEEFKKLCASFILLYKSNECDINVLETMSFKGDSELTKKQQKLFLRIIKPIMEYYDLVLKNNNMIDYDDFIKKATDSLDKVKIHKYKYVIVDDYQDISTSKFNLLKKIISKTNANLFAVGDDYQSIHRYLGNDINYFENFSKYYDNALVKVIQKTYRNSQELITLAGNFISKNPYQIKKDLTSVKYKNTPLYFILYDENPYKMLAKTIDSIIKNDGEDKNILLLGRNSYDSKMLLQSGLFDYKDNRLFYKRNPHVVINYSTVQKSKGQEADNVILINFENTMLGFPKKISEDKILRLVTKLEDYKYAEERRMFYVAITRTKNRTFILTNKDRPSEFYNEFQGEKNVRIIDETNKKESIVCPNCKNGRLIVRKNDSSGNYFLGCSNAPICDYVIADTRVLQSQITCPKCNGFLEERVGVGYIYLGCTNAPECNYTKDEPCPLCGDNLKKELGDEKDYIVCSDYPKCKYRREI